jgi:hypothetical protein
MTIGAIYRFEISLTVLNLEGIHFCISVYLEDMAFYSIDEGLFTELISSPELGHLLSEPGQVDSLQRESLLL